MDDSTNPYAAPQTFPGISLESTGVRRIIPVGSAKRFTNLVIDHIAQYAIAFLIGAIVVLLAGNEGAAFLESGPAMFIGIPIGLAYYWTLEVTTSRTLGKLITRTKVVGEDGGIPTMGQITGRTFARLIPFEAFSFLGKIPRGWHDSLSRTYVVNAR